MDDETEIAETSPTPLWVGLVTWVAVALVALIALEVIGIVLQGNALKASGLTYSDKLGYAFLQNLDQAPLGFELLVAVLLALLPVIMRSRTTPGQDKAAQFVLVAVAGLALLITIGGIIGVPARIHIIHLSPAPNNKVTQVVSRVLITFVIRNVGMSILALVAALAAVRVRFTPRRVAVAPLSPSPSPSPSE
jgi:hypothetical protein